MMKSVHRRIYFLIGGCATVMILLVGLFVWRYQTLNANVAQPAVCRRRLRLPAKVVLNQTTLAGATDFETRNYETKPSTYPHSNRPTPRRKRSSE